MSGVSGVTQHRTLIPLPQVIRAGRVTLRPYTLDDAQAFWEAVQEDVAHVKGDNPSPWRETGQGHQTIDDVRERIVRAQAHWLLREKLWMGIFLTESRRYIGNIGLDSIDWELRRFEIGYWVRPTEEGRGYVGEAVRLLARCAFERLGARRLEIRCDERNTRSRRVAEREGFVREGLLRNDMLRTTGPSNTLVYALIPEDYARVKEMWAGERRKVGGGEVFVPPWRGK